MSKDGLGNLGEKIEGDETSLLPVAPAILKRGHGLDKLHSDFHDSLRDVSEDELIGGLDSRQYQLDATKSIKQGMLNGDPRGQLILGTGGGKTPVAMNLVEQTRGRTLYVAPSRIAVQRAQDEMMKLRMSKSSQRMGEDVFDPAVDMTFATWQMLLTNDRYQGISSELFDLCVFDEAHHFLGPKVSQLADHFRAYQLHMTATPDNVVTSLSSVVPHRYFRYTSDELVANDGFPSWLLFRHEVENERLNEAEVVGDRFSISDGNEDRFLNISHRWSICAGILRERLTEGAKAIVYLPSVNSSKNFIEKVVRLDPVLKKYADRIVHVDGKMKHREIEDIERRFKLPVDHPDAILAVCGKDLWTESLDVHDISDVVLADPCSSIRVFLQRIGRGARPSEGKEHLRVHDVVSTLNRLNVQLAPGSKRPVTVAGVMGLQKYQPGIVLNGPYKNMYWDTAGTNMDTGEYRTLSKMSSRVIPFTERNVDLTFLQDHRYAYAAFEKFAELLGTNVFNLAFYPEAFLKSDEEMTMQYYDGRSFKITFQDFMDATEFFGTIDFIKQKTLQGADALRAEIRRSFNPRTRLLLGIGSEKEKQEAIADYACEIPEDPFDISRTREETFVCPDSSMRRLWEYIFKRIQELEATGSEAIGELKLSFDELKLILSEKDYEAAIEYWANPDEHYNGVGDFQEIARLNNIFASYSEEGLIVDVFGTREEWIKYQRNEPRYMVLQKSHFSGRDSRQGPGFDKYFSQGYFSGYWQADVLHGSREVKGMVHEETAQMIVDSIKEGRDYIVVDNECVDNFIGLTLSEVFGLMGVSTDEHAWGMCGDDSEVKSRQSWNFMNVVQLPDGAWKVPIGHVKLQLLLSPKDPAFNIAKKSKKGGWENFGPELFKKSVETMSFNKGMKYELKRAMSFIMDGIANEDDFDGHITYVCSSEEEAREVAAICLLYGIELTLKGRVISYVNYIDIKGCREVEKPKNAKLIRTIIDDEYNLMSFKIGGVMQLHPSGVILFAGLMNDIYEALERGETTLTIKIEHEGRFQQVCEEIHEARKYLKSYGYKGDVLDVVGNVSLKRFKISLDGLSV